MRLGDYPWHPATAAIVACALVVPACVTGNRTPSPDRGAGAGATADSGGVTGAGGYAATGGASATNGSASRGGAAGAAGLSGGGIDGASGAGVGGVPVGGASASGASGAGIGGGTTFHAFLLLGQSNMAGYPKAQALDMVPNSRIQVLGYDNCTATGRQQDKWAVAVPPLHECWNGAIGPGDYFAKTLIDVIPPGDTIGIVPCAISGEKIETFLKVGGTKYTWLIQRAALAQQAGGVIQGILFHQGESNCTDPAWPGKVNTLVTDLRNDLGIGNVPFLAGELAPTGACSAHNTLVDKLPSVVSNAYVVSAAGLVLDPADTTYHVHFDHDSQVTFGKRFEATLVQALHW